MITGASDTFAIESIISQAYEHPSFLALGYFVIRIKGITYGLVKPDATLLSCSFDEVKKRLTERGRHTAPFAHESDASDIAKAFWMSFYQDAPVSHVLGFPITIFREPFERKVGNCIWAPDGDEAFDDGSFVLQFDIADSVRLIGFKSERGHSSALHSISDLRLPADDYYGTLEAWLDNFDRERQMQLPLHK